MQAAPPRPKPKVDWRKIALIVVGCWGVFGLLLLVRPTPPTPGSPVPSPRPSAMERPAAVPERPARPPSSDPLTFRMKKGYIGTGTRAKLDKVLEAAANPTPAVLEAMIASDPDVFVIGEGMEVVAVDSGGGVLSGVAKVRKKGTAFEFWTVREALE